MTLPSTLNCSVRCVQENGVTYRERFRKGKRQNDSVCDVGELWEKIIVVKRYENSISMNIALTFTRLDILLIKGKIDQKIIDVIRQKYLYEIGTNYYFIITIV